MTDCPNAGIRDLLPDMVHSTLSGSDRERVAEHLSGCADCTAELALLEDARRVLAVAPSMNAARIAGAISRRPAVRSNRFAVPGTWRIAAGIAAIVVGGLTWSMLSGPSTDELQAGVEDGVRAQTIFAAAPGNGSHAVSFAGRLGMLATDQLEALLAEMDDMDDSPALEPRTVLPLLALDEGAER